MTDHQEVEWQFDANDLKAIERWLLARASDSGVTVSPSSTDNLTDTYYDTDDWRCHRTGYALRVRQHGDEIEATMKAFRSPTAIPGLRSRREITQLINLQGLKDLESFKQQKGAVSDRVRLVTGSYILRPMFDVQTHRKSFDLLLNPPEGLKPSVRLGEVTLDDTTILVGEKREKLTRVEIEMKPNMIKKLQPFVDEMRAACNLQPASASKFGTGMMLGNYNPTFTLDLGSLIIDSGSSLGDAAFAVMRKHFIAFLAREPLARLGEDSESIHDMRVATRRLRAAMSLFGSILSPRFVQMRDELKWIAQTLGEVRDLDVQITQLSEWTQDRSLINVLVAEREQAQAKLLEAFDSKRYRQLIRILTELLKRGAMNRVEAKARAVESAPPLIAARWKRFQKAADSVTLESSPEEYHGVRIRVKRLRYAVEFFSDLYGEAAQDLIARFVIVKRLRYAVEFFSELYGEAAQDLIARFVIVQDILGAHQDAHDAMPRLRTLVEKHSKQLTPQTIFAMGEIAQRYAQHAFELRKQFPKASKKLGKRWKALKKEMKKRRGTGEAKETKEVKKKRETGEAKETKGLLTPGEQRETHSNPQSTFF
ncbi:MAG: CHAD domain-containing protein [Chloroflexi bacterium]|nr:CHAD domain-containing protein [Chloroflexota bacterium]